MYLSVMCIDSGRMRV